MWHDVSTHQEWPCDGGGKARAHTETPPLDADEREGKWLVVKLMRALCTGAQVHMRARTGADRLVALAAERCTALRVVPLAQQPPYAS